MANPIDGPGGKEPFLGPADRPGVGGSGGGGGGDDRKVQAFLLLLRAQQPPAALPNPSQDPDKVEKDFKDDADGGKGGQDYLTSVTETISFMGVFGPVGVAEIDRLVEQLTVLTAKMQQAWADAKSQ